MSDQPDQTVSIAAEICVQIDSWEDGWQSGRAHERERCARIAEAHMCEDYSCGCREEIAAAIRSGE